MQCGKICFLHWAVFSHVFSVLHALVMGRLIFFVLQELFILTVPLVAVIKGDDSKYPHLDSTGLVLRVHLWHSYGSCIPDYSHCCLASRVRGEPFVRRTLLLKRPPPPSGYAHISIPTHVRPTLWFPRGTF